ncbi:sugar-binding domain-containing protein [Salana multivorans]|uniref:sugar-binding domain-containing protein n=1 Tax=Salana multivorans TaxID=120377 RepID=UPI000B122F7B|nr:sugar-binding domain-containing protein [Salana multivorans]
MDHPSSAHVPATADTAAGVPDPWHLDLAGEWRCTLDPDGVGEREAWFAATPDAAVALTLPGSLQEQGLGDPVGLDTPWTGSIVDRSFFTDERYAPYRRPDTFAVPFWLQPRVYYRGAAWFSREIEIPPAWSGRRVRLSLERVHWESTVWVDGERIGSERSLTTPHHHDLGRLAPGRHLLTLRVDNRTVVDVGPNAHSVSDHTQGNWNGVVGDLRLTALPEVRIRRVRVFPDAAARTATVRVDLVGGTGGTGSGDVRVVARRVRADGTVDDAASTAATVGFVGEHSRDLGERGVTESSAHVDVSLDLGADAPLWDEFDPGRHELTVELATTVDGREHRDVARTVLGLRDVAVRDGRITVNDRPTFFRGTLECAVFPLTGYPPTDVAAWRRIIEVCRAHGLNLLRFHSWCPPRAAFDAADAAGMYLQVEGPLWANQGAALGEGRAVDAFLVEETRRILDEYGNHPSFVVMAHGNEPAGRDAEFLGAWVHGTRAMDPRRLYTSAAGWPAIPANDLDNVPEPRAHRWGEGLTSRLNACPPSTTSDYRAWVEATPRPIVSHEIGQWCAYPDLDEIGRYRGLMQPRNLEIFRDFLAAAGLEDRAAELLHASGRLQTLCYKEDVEAALRTEGFGGFHLLGLSDFPGQGTALVGVLNAFWESKGYCAPEEFARFCGPTVPLARLPRRTWRHGDDLTFEVQVAHFGAAELTGARVTWSLRDDAGTEVLGGVVADAVDLPLGNGTRLGTVTVPTRRRGPVDRAERLTLWLGIETGDAVHANDWPLWFYPDAGPAADVPAGPAADVPAGLPSGVVVTGEVDEAIRLATDGARVLLELAPDAIGNDVALGFTTVFWNTAWTEGQAPHTLGLVHDPAHRLFRDFPSDGHTDWQWWELLHGARAMLVDGLPDGLEPTVRAIDTWFEARRLGVLVEARLGAGTVAVTSLNLQASPDRPAAAHFRRRLLDHLASDEATPEAEITPAQLRGLLR